MVVLEKKSPSTNIYNRISRSERDNVLPTLFSFRYNRGISRVQHSICDRRVRSSLPERPNPYLVAFVSRHLLLFSLVDDPHCLLLRQPDRGKRHLAPEVAGSNPIDGFFLMV